jgi:hypothetical protein
LLFLGVLLLLAFLLSHTGMYNETYY